MATVLLSFLVLLVANADVPGSCGVSKPLFKVSSGKLISLESTQSFKYDEPEDLSLLYKHSRLWMNTQLIICWFLLIDSWMWQMHAFIYICNKNCFAIPWHYNDVNPSVTVIPQLLVVLGIRIASIKVEPIDTQNWLQVGFSTSVKHLENPLWNFNQIKIF